VMAPYLVVLFFRCFEAHTVDFPLFESALYSMSILCVLFGMLGREFELVFAFFFPSGDHDVERAS